jgi:hypothetical protein
MDQHSYQEWNKRIIVHHLTGALVLMCTKSPSFNKKLYDLFPEGGPCPDQMYWVRHLPCMDGQKEECDTIWVEASKNVRIKSN